MKNDTMLNCFIFVGMFGWIAGFTIIWGVGGFILGLGSFCLMSLFMKRLKELT